MDFVLWCLFHQTFQGYLNCHLRLRFPDKALKHLVLPIRVHHKNLLHFPLHDQKHFQCFFIVSSARLCLFNFVSIRALIISFSPSGEFFIGCFPKKPA